MLHLVMPIRNNGALEVNALLSDGAQDFLRRMMVVDPDERMSLDDASAHPWVETPLQQQQRPAKRNRDGSTRAAATVQPGGEDLDEWYETLEWLGKQDPS